MKYVQPYGISDPEAVYINGNPATGTMGSIPPAASIEHPQREIVSLIKAGGLTASPTDLNQLLRSTRGQVPSFLDDTGAANTIICSYVTQGQTGVPLSGYRKGLTVRIKVKTTNTGPVTINIDAQGAVPVIRGDSGVMTPSEIPANSIIEVVYDGASFQLISQTQRAGFLGIIDTNITKTVYGAGADFTSLETALYWVSRYMISQTGSVTFQFALGQFIISTGSQFVDHPNASRISFKGAPGYTVPVGGDFQFTGNSGTNLLNDMNAHLTMLRARYKTELRFTNSSSIACWVGSSWTGMLISGDGSQTVNAGAWLFTAGANVKLKDIAVHGGGSAGLLFSGGGSSVDGTVTSSGNNGTGIGVYTQMSNAGRMMGMSNNGNGMDIVGGAIWIFSPTAQSMFAQGNAVHGVQCIMGLLQTISSPTIRSNNQWGVLNVGGLCQMSTAQVTSNGTGGTAGGFSTQSNGATIFNAGGTVNSNTTYDVFTSDGSYTRLTGCTVGVVSPVVNTNGNGNSFNFS